MGKHFNENLKPFNFPFRRVVVGKPIEAKVEEPVEKVRIPYVKDSDKKDK
jgi:hypothetical protein